MVVGRHGVSISPVLGTICYFSLSKPAIYKSLPLLDILFGYWGSTIPRQAHLQGEVLSVVSRTVEGSLIGHFVVVLGVLRDVDKHGIR